MPCMYCEICENYIDLDEDVEHFDMHELDKETEPNNYKMPEEEITINNKETKE